MELTDDEFEYLHGLVYDEACYGDDEVVYGDGHEAVMVRAVLAKLDDERDRRG